MIRLHNVCVAYNTKQILHKISLSLADNGFVCLVGKNGCGKSTLLRATAGLMPYQGSIELNGKEICRLSGQERAKQLSYLPQSRPVPEMRVETLIAHGRYPHLGFSKTLTKKDVEVIRFAAQMAGVENLLKQPLGALSGGERQRAYIAMAIAQDSNTLLLDEPVTYLDIKHQLEVMELLVRLRNEGKKILMVAHDLPQAFTYADYVLLMNDGKLLAQGTPQDLSGDERIQRVFAYGLEKSSSPNELYSYKLIKE